MTYKLTFCPSTPFGTLGVEQIPTVTGWFLPNELAVFGKRAEAPKPRPSFKPRLVPKHTALTATADENKLKAMTVAELEADIALAKHYLADKRPGVQRAANDVLGLLEAELLTR